MESQTSGPKNSLRIRGNTSQLLQTADKVWVVESGAIAVFCVRVANGRVVGARRYLFTSRAGDLLFGADPGHSETSRTFLIVGLEDSLVTEYSRDQLATDAGLSTGEIAKRVDDWVRNISVILAEGTPANQAERSEASSADLAASQSLRPPAQSVRWIRVTDGQVNIVGDSHLAMTSDHGAIPLGDAAFITSPNAAKLVLDSTENHHLANGASAGLAHLHSFCFTRLKNREQVELLDQAKRLDDRQRLEQIDTTDALSHLTGTLDQQDLFPKKDTELLTALDVIGKDLKITFSPPNSSEDMSRVADPIEAIVRASRIRYRKVVLTKNWWKQDCGALLGYLGEEERPVALVRVKRFLGLHQYYVMFDPKNMTQTRVDKKLDDELSSNATSFVRPLPETKANAMWSLVKYGVGTYWLEAIFMLLMSMGGTLLGMLTPMATSMLIDNAIPAANARMLFEWGFGLFAISIGMIALDRTENILQLRLRTGSTAILQAGVLDRMFRLPSKFFRRYSSGDLMNRVMMITEVSREISTTAFNGIVTGGMASLNLGLCYYYSPKLSMVAVATAGAVALSSGILATLIRSRALKLEQLNGRLFGFAVQMISGVAKLRVAAAEQRAFNNWARQYSEQLKLMNEVQRIQDCGQIINTGLQTISLTAIFFLATQMLGGQGHASAGLPTAMLSMGTFLAFHSAFGALVSGAVSASNTLVDIMDSLAKRKLMQPILEATVENDASKVDPGRLKGAITVKDAKFRYREDGPYILNGVSIHANPGDFVALVGPSGCGKSTMLKLLLGFEQPESGTVCFDGQDMSGLDMSAVRRQIGVVLQSGYINAGSIFDCIAAGNRISLEEAWEAARDAGFSHDIEDMPMGMHTVLPEGATTLSGGQRQRLLIARALALNPKVLLFDEATSALDNRTQEIVSRSVERRNVTRIVIAHRLSTIQDADRIYVFNEGVVAQSGTYDSLLKEEGLFRLMVARQAT